MLPLSKERGKNLAPAHRTRCFAALEDLFLLIIGTDGKPWW